MAHANIFGFGSVGNLRKICVAIPILADGSLKIYCDMIRRRPASLFSEIFYVQFECLSCLDS
jgi:hypothetical protein